MTSLVNLAQQRLRSQGGRMTAQRQLICETLESSSNHPTAEELHELASRQDPNLNLSTVYRTLTWLESEGLVSVRRFNDERRQVRFDPAQPREHHHFICRQCGVVLEFEHPHLAAIQADFEAEYGASVDSFNVTLYGLCQACWPRDL